MSQCGHFKLQDRPTEPKQLRLHVYSATADSGGSRHFVWGVTEVERRRREDRGAEGAEEGGAWKGGVPLPTGVGYGEKIFSIFY